MIEEGTAREKLKELFTEGSCPSPEEIVGKWKGIFLPFSEDIKIPLISSGFILGILDKIVGGSWGKIWKGKEIIAAEGDKVQPTKRIEGINILLGGIKTLRFDVRRIKSRLDGKEAIEFDYSKNPPPFSFIKDEVRAVRNKEEAPFLIGIMFFEIPLFSTPVIYFGLERKEI